MPKAASIIIAGLGLGCAAGLVIAGSGQLTYDPGPLVRAFEGQLRETATALHARLQTLAAQPRLAAAVLTDAATVRDLTLEELEVHPTSGETIAIGQMTREGRPTLLRTIPTGSTPPSLDRIGTELRISGGKLVVAETVAINTRDQAAPMRGLLAASRPLPLEQVSAQLASVDVAAQLEVGSSLVPMGRAEAISGARWVPVALQGEPARGTRLLLAMPPARRPNAHDLAAILVVLVSVAVAWLAGRRRKSAPCAHAQPSAPAEPSAPAKPPGPVLPGDTTLLPNDASPAAASSPIGTATGAAGRTIGRYTCLRPLGRGGMAEVFLARATGEAGFEKLVALKVLQPGFAQELAVVEHFLDEARLVSKLTHPNIVQTIDLGRTGDEFFIAMEYVEGADLSRLIDMARARNLAIPLRVALAIVRRVCEGLHAAHMAVDAGGKPLGLIHRDVKAANVFVARSGAVKIGDFGIAKVANVNRTQLGHVKGTPGYMAPEQRLGQPLDRRADLYGVGAIGYELLTAMPVNLDLVMLAERGRTGWPHLPPLSRARSDVPPELDAIIFRALAYERDDRYATCAALEEALEEVANRNPPIAGEKAIAQWIATLQTEATAPTQTLG